MTRPPFQGNAKPGADAPENDRNGAAQPNEHSEAPNHGRLRGQFQLARATAGSKPPKR